MLNIAFVGALFKPKGLDTLIHLINDCNLPVNWYLFGWNTIHDTFGIEKRAYIHGKYSSVLELYDLLDYYNIDLVILPSQCPESFSYVLSEILDYGLPVIVSNRGALESRIRENNCGWICNPREMEPLIRRLDLNIEDIYDKMNNAMNYKVPRFDDMISNYLDLYDSILNKE